MRESSYTLHVCLSVDVDRFRDAELRRWAKGLIMNGRAPTVAELRAACREARARGWVVFPNPDCPHPKATGECGCRDAARAPAVTPGTADGEGA